MPTKFTSEAKFYRELLEQIASARRNTIAKRLADSGLMFWDQMQKEKLKRRGESK